MVGCLGFAPSSRRLRAGTSLSKFATQANAKAELNHRGQICEALIDTGISRRGKKIPSAPNRVSGHYFDRAGSLPTHPIHLGNGRACRKCADYSGLEDRRVSLNTYARKWNPVLESHQSLRFCKPPPELLGQRDMKLKCGRKLSPPPALLFASWHP